MQRQKPRSFSIGSNSGFLSFSVPDEIILISSQSVLQVLSTIRSGNRHRHQRSSHHQLEKMEAYYTCLRLEQRTLLLDAHLLDLILNDIDCFVSQSRGNETIEILALYPGAFNGNDDNFWDKLGQAIDNLQALGILRIYLVGDDHDDDLIVVPTHCWEILARILSHVRQEVRVQLDDSKTWAVEEVQALARAIHGHPMIIHFQTGNALPHESMDSLYSALATLPALEAVRLSSIPEDEITLANPESLTDLFLVPSLQSVSFSEFHFTSALCQATANALTEGTAITHLEFGYCSFSVEGGATVVANGLSRNTSVTSIEVVTSDEALYNALATALPSNSTLRQLRLSGQDNDDGHDLSPVFLALGKNTGLKSLILNLGTMDESLSTAMKGGLGRNETLERLEIHDVPLCDDSSALKYRALSFIRTNKALKSLIINLEEDITEAEAYAFGVDILAMLQDNVSLESLKIRSRDTIKVEDYVTYITTLLHNTTLKSMVFQSFDGHARQLVRQLTDDENKQMAKTLKTNYGLERLPDIELEIHAGDAGAILRLNKVGRRYLVQDGSSISKGVEVLSAVSNEINCVFLHLLENPRLCDRSAVEIASDSTEGSRGSTSPANHIRKREQDQALKKGKESRR
jgi:hypothetical protein